jgi:hypothetical protein
LVLKNSYKAICSSTRDSSRKNLVVFNSIMSTMNQYRILFIHASMVLI